MEDFAQHVIIDFRSGQELVVGTPDKLLLTQSQPLLNVEQGAVWKLKLYERKKFVLLLVHFS